MKIAILGSVALPVPPIAQGGTEWIAYYQAKGLAQKGHEIFLFAAKGSRQHFADSSVQVIEVGNGDVVTGSQEEKAVNPHLTEGSRKLRLETTYLSEVADRLVEMKNEYDIVLNNMRGEAFFSVFSKILGKPIVTVLHLPLFDELASFFQKEKMPLIAISKYQRNGYPHLNYLATIYDGVDTKKYSFIPDGGEEMLMIGSFAYHKNQADAIYVSRKTGKKLVLLGKLGDKDYYTSLENAIDGINVIWKGEVSFEEKIKEYRQAKLFLFPIKWEEPFGLVVAEALSCGIPVVAFAKGAIPEIIEDGTSGFLVNPSDSDIRGDFVIKKTGVEGLIEATKRIYGMSESEYKEMRQAARKRVETTFTISAMVASYEKVCATLAV